MFDYLGRLTLRFLFGIEALFTYTEEGNVCAHHSVDVWTNKGVWEMPDKKPSGKGKMKPYTQTANRVILRTGPESMQN